MIVREKTHGFALFFALRGSIIQQIAGKILIAVVLSAVITALHGELFGIKISVTTIPFTLIGLALAIFLGFRNNTSYDRFWEARKLWGEFLIVSRNLARETFSLLRQDAAASATLPDVQEVRQRMVYKVIAFGYAMKQKLRDEDEPEVLKPFLTQAEWQALGAPGYRPVQLLLMLGAELRYCLDHRLLDTNLALAVNASIDRLSYILGGCERIKYTPIPFSYAILMHRTVYLYCFLLPFGLVDTIGYMTPLVVGIVTYTFLGLETIGNEIEEPFGDMPNDLPLNAISRNIEIELRQCLGETDLPQPVKPVDFNLT